MGKNDFRPGPKQALDRLSIGRGSVLPAGRFFAFVVTLVVGSLVLDHWRLGFTDADGAILGLCSTRTDPGTEPSNRVHLSSRPRYSGDLTCERNGRP